MTTITRTTDSFGAALWEVHYIRCGKNSIKTFYDEAQAINFKENGAPLLENEPHAKPRKNSGHSREVPKW